MSRDRIKQIRIRGLRVIEDVTLDLDGLTVLIGDNGSGKSTILEAFEILRLAATPGIRFPQDLSRSFGRIEELIRYGSPDLTLGALVECQGRLLEYSFTIALAGQRDAFITRELLIAEDGKELVDREGNLAKIFPGGGSFATREEANRNITGGNFKIQPDKLVLSFFDEIPPSPALRAVRDALLAIELHVPFEVRPSWQLRDPDVRKSARSADELAKTERVERFGNNLPNCYYQLKNSGPEIWERVLDRAQLALGRDLRDFIFPPSGRGYIEMEGVFAGRSHNIPVHGMSEGQLSFLLLVALVELDASRSILAFDEPEIHLHPSLLVNALYLLEEAAERCPVLLATHSDRLLDALEDPVKSVILCELDEQHRTRFLRPDRPQLEKWLARYNGLGSLRAEGYDFTVFDPSRLKSEKSQA